MEEDLEVYIVYNDHTKQPITEGFTFDETILENTGEEPVIYQDVEIRYGDYSTTLEVLVEKEVSRIEVSSKPLNEFFEIGDTIHEGIYEQGGIGITIYYKNTNETREVFYNSNLRNLEINPIEITDLGTVEPGSEVGTKEITVTYKTEKGDFEDTFNINVIKKIAGLDIYQEANKKEYDVNEPLNTEGLKIYVAYDDGTSTVIDRGFICSPTKFTTGGRQNVEILFGNRVYVDIPHTAQRIITYEVDVHEYEEKFTIDKEATCKEVGSKSKHCKYCNKKIEETENPIDPSKHKWNEGEITTEATCKETGVKTYTCSVCAATRTETIDKRSHEYEEIVTQPTCTEKGYTTHNCKICEDSYKDKEVDALGHSWNEGEITKEATCKETGVKTYTCTRCRVTQTETIAKTEHEYEEIVTQPTCTEKGYTTHTCKICGNSYKDNEVAALGHIGGTHENGGTCQRCRVIYQTHTSDGNCPCGYVDSSLYVISNVYQIDGVYILNIKPNTTITNLLKGITTNAESIKVYEGKTEIAKGKLIGTNMKIVFTKGAEQKTYTAVVRGDVTGDGVADFIHDIIAMNKHRLHKKNATLEGAYAEAGDVNNDDKVDFKDIIIVNKYRLHRGEL